LRKVNNLFKREKIKRGAPFDIRLRRNYSGNSGW